MNDPDPHENRVNPMNARNALLLTASICLLLAPLAQAGSQANPNATDPNDDVSVNDGANCPLPAGAPTGTCIFGTSNDFTFPNADIHAFWANDTADLLVLTVEMKAASSFQRGFADPFGDFAMHAGAMAEDGEFDWAFAFNVSSTAYTASAHMANDGTITCGGVAILCPVHNANQMSFAIPWTAIGSPAPGAPISGLVFTAHGADANGNTLDERAPDVATAADYLAANATAAGNATGNSTGATGNATGNATSGSGSTSASGSSGTVSASGSLSHSGSVSGSFSDSGTNGFANQKAKDSPSVGLLVLGAALGALAWLARRRLD